MTALFMFFHAIICLFLVVIILMQSGRGGGLTEAFASAESMFGANTNEFLTKGTTVLATLFLVTALSLAAISSQKGKSLMSDSVVEDVQAVDVEEAAEEAKVKAEEAAETVAETANGVVDAAETVAVPEPVEPKGSPAQ